MHFLHTLIPKLTEKNVGVWVSTFFTSNEWSYPRKFIFLNKGLKKLLSLLSHLQSSVKKTEGDIRKRVKLKTVTNTVTIL